MHSFTGIPFYAIIAEYFVAIRMDLARGCNA